jgi:hypothetical protein
MPGVLRVYRRNHQPVLIPFVTTSSRRCADNLSSHGATCRWWSILAKRRKLAAGPFKKFPNVPKLISGQTRMFRPSTRGEVRDVPNRISGQTRIFCPSTRGDDERADHHKYAVSLPCGTRLGFSQSFPGARWCALNHSCMSTPHAVTP